MTGEEVLALARSHGVRVTLALGDLRLEADREPPAEALVVLRDYKAVVVAELRKIAATARDWRQIFERHVAILMRVRGLSRAEAERAAFNNLLVEFLNRAHPNTDPNRCAHCGKLETPGATLQPIGWGARHAWLHPNCWEVWREKRRAEAIAQLAVMGIAAPEGNSNSNAVKETKENTTP